MEIEESELEQIVKSEAEIIRKFIDEVIKHSHKIGPVHIPKSVKTAICVLEDFLKQNGFENFDNRQESLSLYV